MSNLVYQSVPGRLLMNCSPLLITHSKKCNSLKFKKENAIFLKLHNNPCQTNKFTPNLVPTQLSEQRIVYCWNINVLWVPSMHCSMNKLCSYCYRIITSWHQILTSNPILVFNQNTVCSTSCPTSTWHYIDVLCMLGSSFLTSHVFRLTAEGLE